MSENKKKGLDAGGWIFVIFGTMILIILVGKCTEGGGGSGEDCQVEYDGRSNPTVCD